MKIKLVTLILIIVLLVGGGLGAYFLLKDKDIGIIKTTKNDSTINIEDSKEKIAKLEEEKSELEKTIEEVENENSDLKKKVDELEKKMGADDSLTNSSSNKDYYSVEDICEIISNHLKNSDKNIKEVKINKVEIYAKDKLLNDIKDKEFIESNFDWNNAVYGEVDFNIKFYDSDKWKILSENNNGYKTIKAPNNWEYTIDKEGWVIFDVSRFFEIDNLKNVKLGTSW